MAIQSVLQLGQILFNVLAKVPRGTQSLVLKTNLTIWRQANPELAKLTKNALREMAPLPMTMSPAQKVAKIISSLLMSNRKPMLAKL
jgi:hypothetical protein